jgi:hypothetical protein
VRKVALGSPAILHERARPRAYGTRRGAFHIRRLSYPLAIALEAIERQDMYHPNCEGRRQLVATKAAADDARVGRANTCNKNPAPEGIQARGLQRARTGAGERAAWLNGRALMFRWSRLNVGRQSRFDPRVGFDGGREADHGSAGRSGLLRLRARLARPS